MIEIDKKFSMDISVYVFYMCLYVYIHTYSQDKNLNILRMKRAFDVK